jgi:hypothetical protein
MIICQKGTVDSIVRTTTPGRERLFIYARLHPKAGLSHLSMAISTLISEEIAGSQPLQRGAMWICPGQGMAINA